MSTIGRHLKLEVWGASHAPSVGMRLAGFPADFKVDLAALQSFMERRAPGRDALSTARREPDRPQFLSGLANGVTDGGEIVAEIRNVDTRPADYGAERTVPRPGHADFGQWIRQGRIPTGGGANSARLTAPMCIAGGLCLQLLAKRGATVSARVVEIGGRKDGFEETVLAAKSAGDSVGGMVEVVVEGFPVGVGGPVFDGVDSSLAAAFFSIPGVKGVEFVAGFAAASMRGSENNDAFDVDIDGRVVTRTNNHGGVLGGVTSGMPLTARIAFKPTPSIFKEQQSVDLATGAPAKLSLKGRHDPCIALRAVPVVEALAAFVLADALLAAESASPRICLTLTLPTIDENLAALRRNRLFVDIAELRVDCLGPEERDRAAEFPKLAAVPTILTIRRASDGGRWAEGEDARAALYAKLIGEGDFAFVDFEDDFRRDDLAALAKKRGVKVVRSLHDFSGPVENVVARCRQLRGGSDEIPKIAFMPNAIGDVARLFAETRDFTEFPHVLCAMGRLGAASRALAGRTNSMLTFASPEEAVTAMSGIGHLTPRELVRTYRFREQTPATALYAVTGWPLEHTSSPELNNAAFAAAAEDAVMVPLPAATAAEALAAAETLGVRGMAVTVPHKEAIMPLLSEVDPVARAIGAVNTVVRTQAGWKGYNTDAPGFAEALAAFLGVESLSGRKIAIVGAGGAARAVAYAVKSLGGDACVFNRTVEKARSLAAQYGFAAAPLAASASDAFAEYADVVVQTTSVGLGAADDSADPVPFHSFTGREAVYDLVYAPAETPLLKRARAAGCRVENGMSMLAAQAREQRRLYRQTDRRHG